MPVGQSKSLLANGRLSPACQKHLESAGVAMQIRCGAGNYPPGSGKGIRKTTVSYYATLQELPGIKEACISIVREITEAAKRKVALSHAEGFEEELSRFVVEDDGDIHPEEWYNNWQEDENWIRVLTPCMKNGYMLSK